MRRRTTLVAAAVLAAVLSSVTAPTSAAGPDRKRPPAVRADIPARGAPVRVGSLTLTPCNVVPGAAEVLPKPFSAEGLVHAVRRRCGGSPEGA